MCFSLAFLMNLLIWLVVIGAVVAIIRLLIPLAAGWLGGTVVQIINIVLYAFVIILIIYFAFELIGCLFGVSGGLRLPRAG